MSYHPSTEYLDNISLLTDTDFIEPNKKILINFTIFPNEEEDIEDHLDNRINHYTTVFIKDIQDKLKYKMLKMTIGVHYQATRPHIHMFVNFQTHKGKIYKYLAQKIAGLNNKFKITDDLHQTIVYEDVPLKKKKSIVYYDEESMRYAFKEGNLHDYYWGFTEPEYFVMRQKATEEWNKLCMIKKAEEEKTKTKNETKKHLYDYTFERYEGEDPHNTKGVSTKDKIRFVIRVMLEYHKQEMLNLDVSRIKNKAIEFLYYYDYVDEDDIIEYIYI